MLEKVRKRVKEHAKLFGYVLKLEQEEEIVALYELNYEEYNDNALSLHIEDYMSRYVPPQESDWQNARRKTVFAMRVSTDNLELPKFVKSPETFEFLMSHLGTNIPLCLLTDNQKRSLVESMYPIVVDEGTVLIKEGDIGDEMYIVEDGEFDISVQGQFMTKLLSGAVFGELALLHGIPRTATVKAVRKSTVWSAQQTSFSCIRIRDQIYRKNITKSVIETDPFFNTIDKTPENISRTISLSKSTYINADSPVDLENFEVAIVLKKARIIDESERDVSPKDIIKTSFYSLTDLECVIVNLNHIKG